MKKFLFLSMLISAISGFAVASDVSIHLVQKSDEIFEKIKHKLENQNDSLLDISRLIDNEIYFLQRAQRHQYANNALKVSANLVGSYVSALFALAGSNRKIGKIIDSSSGLRYVFKRVTGLVGACAVIFFMKGAIEKCVLSCAEKIKPIDPRFANVDALTEFEWEIVEKLDVLLLTPYGQLSETEQDMADRLFVGLNKINPEKYKNFSSLASSFESLKVSINLKAFVADITNADGTKRRCNVVLAQTMYQLLAASGE